jgi:hypothetical protein
VDFADWSVTRWVWTLATEWPNAAQNEAVDSADWSVTADVDFADPTHERPRTRKRDGGVDFPG